MRIVIKFAMGRLALYLAPCIPPHLRQQQRWDRDGGEAAWGAEGRPATSEDSTREI